MNKEIIIVGGGYAGLYCALELSKNFKVILLDDRNYLGGRAVTYYNRDIQYENGAGRFHDKHKLLLSLIDRYNLTKIPLSNLDNSNYYHICKHSKINKLQYIDDTSNQSLNIKIKEIIKYGKQLDKHELQSMTFQELVIKCFQSREMMIQLRNMFGYYAEFSIMNAYDAIRSFELDFLIKEFYILKEGFSKLSYKMGEEIKKNGGIIINNAEVIDVIYNKQSNNYNCKFIIQNNQNQYHNKYISNLKNTKKIIKSNNMTIKKNNIIELISDKVIFCIKTHQLKKFKILSSLKNEINNITSSSLIRIYAIYPKNKKDNKVWFHDIPKITTNHYLRQIIPINKEKGLIMISYTDNKDTNIIRTKQKENKLKEFIRNCLIDLFPNKEIPNPKFLKIYDWKVGVHYWTTNTNSDIISKKMIKPFNNKEIYIAGEGFSQNQAWIEGALETAKKVNDTIMNNI